MVEAVEMIRPTYNAVNINIRKPEVNKFDDMDNSNDKGIYNSVKVDIDNPSVNTVPRKVYEYPEADGVVTYDMAYNQPVALPPNYPVITRYEASEIIIPEEVEESDDSANAETINKSEEEAVVPEPNYTTVEAEKKALNDEKVESAVVAFHGNEQNIKKPEIVPSVDIKPEVDINSVVANLESEDYDKQALQMNEIVSTFKDNDKAKQYIVSDVFSSLINIVEKDVSNLEGPSKEQLEIRKRIMENFDAIQNPNNKDGKMPHEISDADIAKAATLSPMELADRNKEYALITMAMLDKIYIDDVEKENGTVVAMTDIPGISAMFDTVRYSKNPILKVAAIDSLRYIARPEYKNELSEVFNIAKSDSNPVVAEVAEFSLNRINQK